MCFDNVDMKRFVGCLTCITDIRRSVGRVYDQNDKQKVFFYNVLIFVFLISDIHDTYL